ncbi:MAG: DNA replication/repair protein RecF [Oscillospiraceae bacterium]|nr:DNA replication/repair protein RecF [Oscillospiraceae bacterium]
MRLCALSVKAFRNIPALSFTPSPRLNVIYGQNGQGKTNLLESIWLLTGGKSFRGGKDAELIKKDCDAARIEADILAEGRQEEDTIILTVCRSAQNPARASRMAGRNGADMQRASQLAGIFPAVVFAPVHLNLVKGGPEGRRRFIDAALCQLYPGYLEEFRRYTRLLNQKNALLKEDGWPDEELFEVFDRQLSQSGSALIKRRQDYLSDLAPSAAACYHDISAGRETLHLSYQPSVPGGEDPARFLAALRENRRADRFARFATAGPHRDDLSIKIDGEDAKVWASQGQQRSAVLAMKIAEASAIERIVQETPVLMLDDVLSELDAMRQDFLLNRLQDKQVFVTSCETDLFKKTDGLLFEMYGGVGTLRS